MKLALVFALGVVYAITLVGGQDASCGTPARLTDEEKAAIVAKHNEVRRVEPASNMKALVWSDELAAKAQEWADQCTRGHGMQMSCKNKDEQFGQNAWNVGYPPGQDIGDMYPEFDWNQVIGPFEGSWASEKENWDFSSDACYEGKVCGHWTQVVWAQTSEVGCGFNKCPTAKGLTNEHNIIAVCNYRPGGNVEMINLDGSITPLPVYLKGESCSNCDSAGEGKQYSCVDKLCTPA